MENPGIEFDHFLAEKLGKSLGWVRALPNAEYVEWQVYYAKQAQARQLASRQAQARR